MKRTDIEAVAEQLASLAPLLTEPLVSALASLTAGQALADLGQHEQAMHCLERARDLYVEHKSTANVAVTNMSLGLLLSVTNRRADALRHYDAAIDVFSSLELEANLAAALANKAHLLTSLGDIRVATQLMARARRIFRRCRQETEVGLIDLARSQIACTMGHSEKALRLAAQAGKTFEEFGLVQYAARAKHIAGNILRGRGEFERAEAVYLEARALLQGIGDELAVAKVDGDRAHLCGLQGKLEEAASRFRALRASFKQHGALADVAQTAVQEGVSRMFINQLQEAWILFAEAESTYDRLEMRQERARVWTNMAIILDYYLDRQEDALPLYDRAIAVFRSQGMELDLARTFTDKANCLAQLAALPEALALYGKAEGIFQRCCMKRELTRIQMGRASAYLQMRALDDAEDIYNRLLEKQDTLSDPGLFIRCHAGKSAILRERGMWSESLAECQRAIQVFEEQRLTFDLSESRMSLMRDKRELYEQAVLLSLVLSDRANALHYVERCKSRTFLEHLALVSSIMVTAESRILFHLGIPARFQEIATCLQEA